MTDLNAPYDATERDALAWRMLEERLEMGGVTLDHLFHPMKNRTENLAPMLVTVFGALHDALAYRRQT